MTRDYRKAHGLCFYCAEKFDANHNQVCARRPGAQVNALVVNNLETNLIDDVLNQLAVEDVLAEDLCQLSLNALAGTDEGEALKVKALVHNKTMLILIDSVSTHSFVSSSFLSEVGLQPIPTSPKQVKLANWDMLITDQWVPQFAWSSNGHTLQSDMKVLELRVYDAILGYNWLAQHSLMMCHWDQRMVEFEHQGKQIKLVGVPQHTKQIHNAFISQVLKWSQGNELWAMAVVETVQQPNPSSPDHELQQVLKEFAEVFQSPNKLPPKRFYDHQIPLSPGAALVNSMPYKYNPLQKNGIEKQLKELLEAGFIERSNSPFASPLLLVLKKDDTWRFFVDYRKLNSMTIKNQFPMPLIDDILDELAGAMYFTELDMKSVYHQVCMKPQEEHKTAFKIHQGHNQFKLMPFG